ncbi:hypothetical protein VPHD51_0148 [Vibrio phage D51]
MVFIFINLFLAFIGLFLGEEDHMWFFKGFTVIEILLELGLLWILLVA